MLNDQITRLCGWAEANQMPQASDANLISVPRSTFHQGLPVIKPVIELLAKPPTEPPELVHGLIHQGTKTMIGGGSKSKKTFLLTDLSISVSAGIPWCGRKTQKGRVLLVNFEIHEAFMLKRVQMVAMARQCPIDEGLSLWNLRGYACSAEKIIPQIIERIRGDEYALVILDPFYKLAAGREENNAGDVTEILNSLERVAVETGAAVVFASHFSKGNAASKDAIDRVSGSGVFARDPDTILPLTPHSEDDAFVVEPILRNFPPVTPFVLRWEHPLMHLAGDLDPSDLKRPTRKHKPTKHTPTLEEYMGIFPDQYREDPNEALLKSEQITALFKEQDWDTGAIKMLRDQAYSEGRLKVHRGPHNRLLVGRPEIIDQWQSLRKVEGIPYPRHTGMV